MWLFIETTRPDMFTVGLLGGTTPKLREVQARSHAVNTEVFRLLTPSVKKQLDGICVVSGPGSFTSTRTGVIIANLLSRQYRLPLVGVSLDEAKDLDVLTDRLTGRGGPRPYEAVSYVAPVYSSEPNITIATC